MAFRFVTLLALLALAGCAALPAPMEELGPPLSEFAASGRLSLRQGDRSDHLQFDWRHRPDFDAVVFSTPLGQGLAELGRDGNQAWLRRNGEAEVLAPDWRQLTQKLLGAPVPLDVLAAWLGGGRPCMAGEEAGWRIAVIEVESYLGHRLPRLIEIRGGNVELRIVVTERGQP